MPRRVLAAPLLASLLASLLAVLAPRPALSANVVAVHGLLGFGPGELLNVGYWGFPNIPLTVRANYLDHLADYRWGWSCGCIGSLCTIYCQTPRNRVLYAKVGPVSSNHDRACELYAQIVGARTDYGYFHSRQYGHARWGPDYRGKGFLPSWSSSNKIHLVGHSMGGQTIRWLELYMRQGLASERAAYPAGEPAPSPLFTGSNRDWIKSMHLVSSPLAGSPLYTALGQTLVDALKDILVNVAGLLSFVPILGQADWGYNFQLDQFGLSRNQYSGGFDNGFGNYLNAVLDKNKPIWSTTFKDLASYDMGPQAAFEFNARTKYTYPGTFYFTHATSRTKPCGASHCPNDAELLMAPTALVIGSINSNANKCVTFVTCSNADAWCQRGAGSSATNFCYDWAWQESDGLVPWRSSISPSIGVPRDQYVAPRQRDQYSNSWAAATWYYKNHTVPSGNGRDHIQIIGLDSQKLWLEDGSDNAYKLIADEIAYAAAR